MSSCRRCFKFLANNRDRCWSCGAKQHVDFDGSAQERKTRKLAKQKEREALRAANAFQKELFAIEGEP